ncbi:arsenic resistance protein [Planomicrobium okeanokoites]|uniref:arsenic resistance protein n=1 Tax=Planomicrobium okeanokoites TaxID=244 RepID=UPI0030F7AB7D
MNLFEKLYTLIILSAVAIGIAAGQIDFLRENSEIIILPLLVLMLYITFLQIPLERMKQAFGNLKFTSASLWINFLWTPLLAWLLASIFLVDQPALFIGFIMLLVTPCTDWYLIFTGIGKGNTALSAAILPINLVLQVVLLPVYLLLFTGVSGTIKLSSLLGDIGTVLLLPLLLAAITRTLLRKKPYLTEGLSTKLSSFPLIFLSFAIAAMFASQGTLLFDNLDLLLSLLLPTLLFFFINFFVGQTIGKFLNFSYEDKVSLSLTTLARNSPIALAIAMTAFPDQPLIALTLIIGPLLELPILALITEILIKLRNGVS